MQYRWVVGADAIEVMQWLASGHQIVLAQRFEPVDAGVACKNRLVVVGAQAEHESQYRLHKIPHRITERGALEPATRRSHYGVTDPNRATPAKPHTPRYVNTRVLDVPRGLPYRKPGLALKITIAP